VPATAAQQKDGINKQTQANTAAAQPQTTPSTVPVAAAAVKPQQSTPQAAKLQSPYPAQPTLPPQQQLLQRQGVGNVAAAAAQTRKV
jgi:hypothetical protein